MGLSETIVAAMIGAAATVTTALFQIFTAIKARSKPDAKPRRGSALRSVLAVMALMIASAAGGFLYSELLRQRGAEDIRAMRQELRELRELTAENAHRRGMQEIPVREPEPVAASEPGVVPASLEPVAGTAESIVYVPACRPAHSEGTADCAPDEAQHVALCGTVPAAGRVSEILLFAQPDAVQQPWAEHRAAVEQDLGGARFTGQTFEYAQGTDLKAVCVNFAHWSGQHPHIARIVVQYDSNAPAQAVAPAIVEAAPALAPAVITSTTAAPAPQAAAFSAPGSR